MTSIGLDAHGSMRFFMATVASTFIAAFLFTLGFRRLSRGDARAWARNGVIASTLIAVWLVSINRDVFWTAVPALAGIVVCAALAGRELSFSRRDLMLIPATAAVYLALVDLMPSGGVDHLAVDALAVVFGLRIIVASIGPANSLAPGSCFSLAPLALAVESSLLGIRQRHAGWPALVIVVALPILLRLTVRNTPLVRRRLRALVVLAMYPMAALSYTSATSIVAAERKPRVNFFEDGLHLTPANEVLRGEKPYRDIIPAHGLIQDALLDAGLLRLQNGAIGPVLVRRETLSQLMAVAEYAITAAVTASPDVGIVGFFAGAFMGYTTAPFRFLTWMIFVAFCTTAAARRRRWMFVSAGALVVLTALTSIEFGCYAALTLAVVILRIPRVQRRMAALAASAGAGALALIAAIMMMSGGYFGDFVSVTVREILTLGPIYALPPFTAPKALEQTFPELITAFVDRTASMYCIWIVTLIGVAVAATRGGRDAGQRRRRIDALFAVALTIVVGGVSYAERHHIYFRFFVPSLLVCCAYVLFRERGVSYRVLATAVVVLTTLLSGITSHLVISAMLRRARGPLEQGWRAVDLPRAKGALFADADAATIMAVNDYVGSHLGPDDTFFDFTNRPLLYALLNRDVPIRQLEVAFYESEQLQREVIARIQLNPSVRAAIVPPPGGDPTAVDFVPSSVRAPLVWQFLNEHFEPDTVSAGVVFWKRKS